MRKHYYTRDSSFNMLLLENGAAINYDTSTDEELPLQTSLKTGSLA
jgi:hypothetical protein